MRVYLAYLNDYDNSTPDKVFSTLEAAKAFAEEGRASPNKEQYSIYEFDVDGEMLAIYHLDGKGLWEAYSMVPDHA